VRFYDFKLCLPLLSFQFEVGGLEAETSNNIYYFVVLGGVSFCEHNRVKDILTLSWSCVFRKQHRPLSGFGIPQSYSDSATG
jgi:hypothetical protein